MDRAGRELNEILALFIGLIIAWACVAICGIQSNFPAIGGLVAGLIFGAQHSELERLWNLKKRDFQ